MKKNIVIIHHHTGLGDHFNCAGMVRMISKKKDAHCFVITKDKYIDIIKYMYKNDDDISVSTIPSEPWQLEREFAKNEYKKICELYDSLFEHFTASKEFISIGHENYPWNQPILKVKNPWEIFYDQLKFDYSIRTEYFLWPENQKEELQVYNELNPSGEEYAFIHEDASRDLLIDRTKITTKNIISNPQNINPFLLKEVIKNAKEIHCIDSSMKCLIDLMPENELKGDLFLHNVREYAIGTLTNKWNIV